MSKQYSPRKVENFLNRFQKKQDEANQSLAGYRDSLLATQRFLNESYDKLVVLLSGGAIGLSITFLADTLKGSLIYHPELLVASWLAFVLSIAGILVRVLFGMEACRKAVRQVDEGTIYQQRPGGGYAVVTRVCQMAAAVSLILGLILIALFVSFNLR